MLKTQTPRTPPWPETSMLWFSAMNLRASSKSWSNVACEKVKRSQAETHPDLHRVRVGLHNQDFRVIPVADLPRMTLSSFRTKGRVRGALSDWLVRL